MIKFFTNKKIWEKVLLALIFVILFQFAVMEPVRAEDNVTFPGKLLSPILSLFVSLCDGIMDVLGRTIMGANSSLYEVEMGSSFWETLGTVIVAIAAAALAIAVVVVTAGAAAAALATIGITATVTVGMGTVVAGVVAGLTAATWFNDEVLPEDVYLPMYTYSAEEIFKGNILLFDVNFFDDVPEIQSKTNENGEVQYYYYEEDGEEIKTSNQSSVADLKETISTWYNALRNICLVLMLSVLVYIGIRILLASVANDRAKYMNMLKDWLVGLCLLFLMHYIMAFSVTLVEKLTDVVKASVDENIYMVVMQDKDGKLSEAVDEEHLNQPETIQEENGEKYLYWPTNLMGSLRLQLQMQQYGAQYVGLAICFLALTFFTLYFTFVYLRRVLYMAFLTMIAPMVALTYCIDKLNDGTAQGFNKWLKEYIFNLLIQPMHLLLYYILITSAFNLAGQNVVYSIVAIGFLIPAEKLLRSLFGFEKASTTGSLSGAAGVALAASAVHKLTGLAGKREKGSKNSGDSSGENTDSLDNNSLLKTNSVNSIDQMLNSGDGEQSQAERQNRNIEENQTPQQQMIDADDEKFGTDDWDPQQREALLREENKNDEGMQYSDDEYRQILRDSGYDEDTINEMMGENDNSNQGVQQIDDNNVNDKIDSNEKSNNDNNIKQQKTKKGVGRHVKRVLRSTIAASKVAGKNAGKRFLGKIPQLPGHIASVAVGAAAGTVATAAMMGVATASGDPSKVGTAVATGLGAGYVVSKAAKGNSIDPEVVQAYNRMYNSPEYADEMREQRIKELKRDDGIRQKMYDRLGKNKTEEIMQNGGNFEKFLQNGIDDVDDIIAGQRLIDHDVAHSVDHATAIIQNDKRMGRKDPDDMSKKSRDEWRDTFKEEYMLHTSEQKANDTVDDTMYLVHELHKAKKNDDYIPRPRKKITNRNARNTETEKNVKTKRNSGRTGAERNTRRTRNSNNTNSSESGNNSSDNGNSSN